MGFDPVSNKVVFPDLESEILDYWKINDTFKKSIEIRENSPLFSFYEGPPTANGTPGVHHVLSRVFKDIVPRFKTMQGFNVPRKGGWDTHGLPVELAVETELDLHSKTEIEQYGVEKFNEKCRESVFRYVKEWEMLSDRIGFWVDMDDPYVTFKNDYIESGWWIFKELWNKNLIYKDYKVTPHCPRCVTSLSSHEVALGYKEDTEDPSVYIKFLVKEKQESNKLLELKSEIPTSLLVWTTTPWTLPANVGIAVSEESKYIIIEGTFSESREPERLILAEELADDVINESYKIIGTMTGQDLIGVEYEPLYALSDPKDNAYRVVSADFVSLSDGTGLVHIAPAYGAEDLNVGRTENLPIIHVVDLNGAIEEFTDGPQKGLFFKEADPLITEHLKEKGRLLRSEKIEHTYPFCWRCDAPLLYYAKESWYIKTTQLKDRLIETNRDINWHPEHIRDGRFGEWLENNVDWALSRERFWGTPIPVWVCKDCNHQAAIGSLEELKSQGNLQGFKEDLDLHRPFVDDVTFSCDNCGGTSHRVPEVMDAWFDSGAMPVAQLHYPFEGKEDFELQSPADYVCEGVDQTRGWFYTLHALSVLLFDRPAYKNVVSLG
ncbi:MAG: isoleucine--tRNA ligase, partial [Chloroflexota bacterium]|nr:isoleucine--tRNA ligase [Chloroflexota bacterium]